MRCGHGVSESLHLVIEAFEVDCHALLCGAFVLTTTIG